MKVQTSEEVIVPHSSQLYVHIERIRIRCSEGRYCFGRCRSVSKRRQIETVKSKYLCPWKDKGDQFITSLNTNLPQAHLPVNRVFCPVKLLLRPLFTMYSTILSLTCNINIIHIKNCFPPRTSEDAAHFPCLTR